ISIAFGASETTSVVGVVTKLGGNLRVVMMLSQERGHAELPAACCGEQLPSQKKESTFSAYPPNDL
ncbi:MAG: hypothetical protein WCE36_23235, partial [Pseudolabrys sp.]